MVSANGIRFTPNLVVGLTLTAAGAVLLLDTLDMVNARDLVRFWPVVLVLFGLSVIAQALQGGPVSAPGVAQRPIITPGFVIMLAIVGIIASNVVQRRSNGGRESTTASVFAVMSNSTRTSTATPFRGADMTTVMGRSRLDLSDAVLAPGEEAVIDVFGMMGSIDIVVPEGWDVQVEAFPVMGRVRDRRFLSTRGRIERGAGSQEPSDVAVDGAIEPREAPPAPAEEAADPPRVTVRGFIMMGAVNIGS